MKGVNNVTLIGNLGADPEVRYMPSGVAVANFNVATTEEWKDKQTGEKKSLTEWHRVVLKGRLAEIAGEYLKKGSLVYLQGRNRTRKWTDKNEVERSVTEVHCMEMQMLGGNGNKAGEKTSEGAGQRPAPAARKDTPPVSKDRWAPQAPAADGGLDLDDDVPF